MSSKSYFESKQNKFLVFSYVFAYFKNLLLRSQITFDKDIESILALNKYFLIKLMALLV